jgi:hypothetical protein
MSGGWFFDILIGSGGVNCGRVLWNKSSPWATESGFGQAWSRLVKADLSESNQVQVNQSKKTGCGARSGNDGRMFHASDVSKLE